MKTTERLKQEIFKEVQASGLFKEVQSKLKTEVLSLVEKESNQNKKQMGFQYEHPLLPKLRKYPLTSLCMDLIQEFLESFKFKYTLSVFKKEINREGIMNRMQLANNFQIEMKNPQSQAVLLSLVSQLVSGDIKVNQNKQNNAFVATNKTQPAQTQPRVNNFIGNNYLEPAKPVQDNNGSNFAKKSGFNVQDVSSSSLNDKSKLNNSSSVNNSTSQDQPSSNKPTSSGQSSSINQSQQQTPSSSAIDTSVKPSQNEASSSKQQSNLKQTKDEKGKKKKKKQVQKPPEGAADLMGELMGKFKTKDTKAEEEIKKKKLFEEKRAFSEQKAKKVLDPSESGANKIRGVSMGKVTGFMSKFMPQSMNPVKNESYIEQEMDEFQQSKDSTRKNPLYSSTESGFDKSGYYDMSVDSNAINDFEYVEKAKKFTKKF